ncbi:MAG: PEP-CTERM sorting domain-containing protein [Burkholderiales bacterium]|nr:PEP-CTERM sorting domain-containing protein [Phycisphaerae bacterium]
MLNEKMRNAVITAAIMGALPMVASATATNDAGFTTPVEYVISTTGATALGAINKGANTDTSNNPSSPNRGIYALGWTGPGGAGVRIGRSVFTQTPSIDYLGVYDKNSSITGEAIGNDRFQYMYHEVGSVGGINELIRGNGLASGSATPSVPSVSAPLWIMGHKQISATQFYSSGGNVNTSGGYSAVAQPTPRIAWSDVKSFQAFAYGSASNAGAALQPQADGYGIGRSVKGANFQRLTAATSVNGETDVNGLPTPNLSRLRNEDVAVVPFTLSANPGTGLDRVTETEGRWLQTHGRLANGANFNSTTREIGSGTRNQGANNLNLDPAFAWGERDRRATAAYSSANPTGTGPNVNVAIGDEADPNKALDGGASAGQFTENRIGPGVRFADKRSGGSGVRPIVANNRMAIGIISAGDVKDRGKAGNSDGNKDPMRVLAIDFDFQVSEAGAAAGYFQPKAEDVAEGRYQMWSSAQAVTVIGVDSDANGTFDAYGTVGGDTGAKSIYNDQIDIAGSNGTHRKFLQNITNSVAGYSAAPNNVTPADGIIAAGFFPNQLMKVSKVFDGGIQGTRTLSTIDPDDTNGNGVIDGGEVQTDARSESELYGFIVQGTGTGTLGKALDWTRAGDHNGDLGGTYKYEISTTDQTSAQGTDTPTGNLTVTSRTVLAGDTDGNGVRDRHDTVSFANIYAQSIAAGVTNTATTGQTLATGSFTVGDGLGGSQTLTLGDTIVLTDINGDGNVTGTVASADWTAVDRDDIEFFLFGSTIETDATADASLNALYSNATELNGRTAGNTAQNRREIGVRAGKLVKNTSVGTFNTTILAATLTDQQKADAQFEIRDVNRSGSAAFVVGAATRAGAEYKFLEDALAIDSVDTMNFANFDQTLAAQYDKGVDLTRANLSDTNTTIGQEDMDVMNAALKTTAVVNPTGRVDHTWSATTKTGSLNINWGANAGTVVVPTDGTLLTIQNGTFEASGTVDPFTAGGNSLAIATGTTGKVKTSNGSINTVLSVSGTGTIEAVGASKLNVRTNARVGTIALATGGKVDIAINGTGTGVSTVKTITNAAVTGGFDGTIELHDNDLVVDYTGGSTSYTSVLNQVKSGLPLLGFGGNGTGIASAEVQAQGAGGVGLNGTMLGVVDGASAGGQVTTLSGFTVANPLTSVLVKYTWRGDANLDGVVNGSDYALADTGFSGGGTGWFYGDVNYDGVINGSDYALIDTGFSSQTGPLPEPAMLSLLGLGAMGILRRRRRAV